MPVKWTPEVDQILLLKILETSDVAPKCAEISEKWPTGVERPTPRAISERILKIRANAKASGASSHFSVSSAKSNTSTPRKSAANGITTKKATPKKTNGEKPKAGKRKRARGGSVMSDDEANSEPEPEPASDDLKPYDAASEVETPRKKSKANTTAAKSNGTDLVKVKREEAENGACDDVEVGGSYFRDPFVEDDAGAEMVDYAF